MLKAEYVVYLCHNLHKHRFNCVRNVRTLEQHSTSFKIVQQ